MEHAMSSIRHLDKLNAAVTVTHGTFETPEFQRQGRDFAAALKDAGKKARISRRPMRISRARTRSPIPTVSTAAPRSR
jgi:arylformamidase